MEGMAVAASAPRGRTTYRFGAFELDETLFELRRGGTAIAIEPRVFNALRYLIRARERVVPKEELLEQLWPGQFVSNAALTYCIKMARKAVGDSGTQQDVIRNLHGRGYRFVAEVELARESGAAHDAKRVSAFVGRAAEMAQLRTCLSASFNGHSGLALVSGEAGIGKTRLLDELAAEARECGARVLIGRCYEGAGAPAFWPWRQMLRSLFSGDTPAPVAELGELATDIAELVPEVAKLVPSSQTIAPLHGAQARFRLFDSLTTFLRQLARAQPMLLALDDLHWADTSSLRLLQFVAREIGDTGLLLLGTYRDLELAHDHPFVSTLGELARVEGRLRLPLAGLSEAEVAQVITQAAGQPPAQTLAAAVWKKSDGNPFFVTEIARLLAPDGATTGSTDEAKLPIPPTVREATERRLLALPKATQLLLRLAAVIGRSFDVPLLIEAAAGRRGRKSKDGKSSLVAALAGASEQKLIEAEAPQRFRFVHALTREAIYEQLSTTERVAFHHAVGTAMESRAHGGLELAAELANHFGHIGNSADVPRAIRYATLAAQHAGNLHAYEEAAALYERALRFAAQQPATERAELLLALGNNQWKAGSFNTARATFVAAAGIARTSGDAAQLARAALGYGGGFRGFELGIVEPALVDLLEESLQLLGEHDSALRAQVLARLAVALYDVSGSYERRNTLSRDAVGVAQRVGDDDAHLGALYSRHWAIWGPDNLDDRVAVADAMVHLATQTRDHEMRLHAHRFRYLDRLELADFAGAEEDFQVCAWLSEELRQPYYRWYVETMRGMQAMAAGQIDLAEQHVERALTIGQRAQSRNVLQLYGGQMLLLRFEQGRLAEMETTLRNLVEQYPRLPSWRCGLAYILSQLGKTEEARRQFDAVAENGFRGVTRNSFWIIGFMRLADVCWHLDDRPRAAVLYELLEPHRLRTAASIGAVCYGTVARALALLAAVLDDWPAAHAHFAQALQLEQQAGWTLIHAHTQRGYGEALLKAGREAERAHLLLAQATATYARLGLQTFVERVAKWSSLYPLKRSKPPLAIARARR